LELGAAVAAAFTALLAEAVSMAGPGAEAVFTAEAAPAAVVIDSPSFRAAPVSRVLMFKAVPLR